jgi:hypothetical protein
LTFQVASFKEICLILIFMRGTSVVQHYYYAWGKYRLSEILFFCNRSFAASILFVLGRSMLSSPLNVTHQILQIRLHPKTKSSVV